MKTKATKRIDKSVHLRMKEGEADMLLAFLTVFYSELHKPVDEIEAIKWALQPVALVLERDRAIIFEASRLPDRITN